jgi:adenylate cyclase class 2
LTHAIRPPNLKSMAYEVEVKYRSVDHSLLEQRLAALGAIQAECVDQVDIYLNHPARDFAVTNEAFRLRSIGDENRMTFKGPREPGPTKTREEIEVRVADGRAAAGQLLRLFELLGFRPAATIRKRRTSYQVRRGGQSLEVALDHALSLGDFAEIEALAASGADLPNAQSAVLALAADLGLTEVEPTSYLRMALEIGR